MTGLIWAIIVLLVVAWFLGFAVNIGWWINVLLALAVLGILFNLIVYPLLLVPRRRTGPVDDAVTHTHPIDGPGERVVHYREVDEHEV